MDESSVELFKAYQQTSADDVAKQLYERYVQRLTALARRRLSNKLAARLDPEDVVQSAYRSFFVRARDGRFEIRSAGDLWRLLAETTMRKLYRNVEHHQAQRRDLSSERSLNDLDGEQTVGRAEPSVEEVAAITEQLATLMSKLDKSQRRTLEMRLQD